MIKDLTAYEETEDEKLNPERTVSVNLDVHEKSNAEPNSEPNEIELQTQKNTENAAGEGKS